MVRHACGWKKKKREFPLVPGASRVSVLCVMCVWWRPRGGLSGTGWRGEGVKSDLNRWSSSLDLYYHVPLERDQGDWDWRLRFNEIPNATGSTQIHFQVNFVTDIISVRWRGRRRKGVWGPPGGLVIGVGNIFCAHPLSSTLAFRDMGTSR